MEPIIALSPYIINALFLFIIIVMLSALLLAAVKDYREKSKALATLAPGPYVRKSMLNNPFFDEYNYVTVLEVKDGWVKYHYTLDAKRNTSHHSDKAENFVCTYTRCKS